MAATKLYGGFLSSIASKTMDLGSDTLKVMLCTSAYVPDQDNHSLKSHVTNEVVGTGYTAGGKTLTGVAASYDAPSNTLVVNADKDYLWPNSTITPRWAVFYNDTAVNKPLICYADLGGIYSVSGLIKVSINASGLVRVTAA